MTLVEVILAIKLPRPPEDSPLARRLQEFAEFYDLVLEPEFDITEEAP